MNKEQFLSKKSGKKSPKEAQIKYEERITQSLRKILHSLEIHSRQLSTKHKVTTHQLACLMALKNEALTSTMIAQKISMSSSTVVGILDRLEQKSFITRTRDTKDRRLVYSVITDKGRKILDLAPSPLNDKFTKLLRELSDQEIAHIASSLEKIAELMSLEKL